LLLYFCIAHGISNRLLRRIFGPKMEELAGGWKRLHILRSFITCTVMKSRRMRWPGHVARMGEMRNVFEVFVGKHEGNRPRGRPKCRWEHNIRMGLKETGWGGVD
jgi:hypothetical protein